MKFTALAAPLLMLAYGILRVIDGLDGQRKDGFAWDAGHVCFLVAMVLYAGLAVLLARRAEVARRLAMVAAAAAVFGAGCFIWVIIGDLFEEFSQEWPLPAALELTGPLLFVLGLVVLLSIQVASGRLPVWSPVLLFAGYAAISIKLDLLPLAALLVLGATAPLAWRCEGSRRVTPAGSRPR